MTLHCLYSSSTMDTEELEIIKDVIGEDRVSDTLYRIDPLSIVIPRYRFVPFGSELEKDIEASGSSLLNSYREHRNIADLSSWIHLLEGLTAPAYTIEEIASLPEGEYFVKGETNSKKNSWFKASYAPDKKSLLEVVSNLQSDLFIGQQRVFVRPFRKYRQIGEAVNGRPIFHERRAFFLDGELLTDAFYWSSHAEELGDTEILNREGYERTLKESIERVGHLARFLVIDVAEFPDGTWEVVELNDGVMSGLSENPASTLWSLLKERLNQ